MNLVRHVTRVLVQCAQLAVASRRFSLLLLVVVGLPLLLFAIVAKVAAPFVIYPFI